MSFSTDNTLASQNNVFVPALPKPPQASDLQASHERVVNIQVAASLSRDHALPPKPGKSKANKAAPVVYIVEDGLMGDNGVFESQEGVSDHIELTSASAKASEPSVTVVKFDLPGTERLAAQDFQLSNYHQRRDWTKFYDSAEGREYRVRVTNAIYGGYKDGLNKLRERLKPGDVVSFTHAENFEIASLHNIPGLENLSKDNLEEKAGAVIKALSDIAYGMEETDLTGIYQQMLNYEKGRFVRVELTAGEVKVFLENRAAIEQIAREGNKVFVPAGNIKKGMQSGYFNLYGLMDEEVSPNVVVVGINAKYAIKNSTVDITGKKAAEGAGVLQWDNAGRPFWHFRGAQVPLSEAKEIPRFKISKLSDEQKKAIGDFSANAPINARPTSPGQSLNNFNKAVVDHWNKNGVDPGFYRVDDLFSFLKDKKGFASGLINFLGNEYEEIEPRLIEGTSFITPWEAAKEAVRQSRN